MTVYIAKWLYSRYLDHVISSQNAPNTVNPYGILNKFLTECLTVKIPILSLVSSQNPPSILDLFQGHVSSIDYSRIVSKCWSQCSRWDANMSESPGWESRWRVYECHCYRMYSNRKLSTQGILTNLWWYIIPGKSDINREVDRHY